MADPIPSTTLRHEREERRRRYRKRLPEYFCQSCSSLTYTEDRQCLECATLRPFQGWTSLSKSRDPWLGQALGGRYLLVKRLGQGATATVYHAESLSIPRQFAIKITDTGRWRGERDAERIVARLNREVEALGRLRSPHVVSCYEVLELEGYSIATVMDLVAGVTLEEMIAKGGPVSVQRACMLLRQIANGLYEAHQAGMIHRDLKPENIMVERMPAGDDFVFVLDFGIVHVEDNVNLTQGFIGTPLYASPEQAVAGKVDHRSDIYSLGAVMYFMLTGRPPFLSKNVYNVLQMHGCTKPRRLSEIDPTRLFPENLEKMVARMLAKSPDDRPGDLSQVIEDLDLLGHGSYSAASVHSAATQESSPHIVESSSPAILNSAGWGREGSKSNSTVLGHHCRPQMQTPIATRDIGDCNSSHADVMALPAQATFSTPPSTQVTQSNPTTTSTLNLPVGKGPALAACAPGPKFALLAHVGQILRLFSNVRNAERVLRPTMHATALSMAMSQTHLVWGHVDGTISRMDMLRGETAVLFQDVHKVGITSVATDPRDRLIVAGSASGQVYISRFEKTSVEWGRMKSGDAVTCVAVSPATDTVAVARQTGEIQIFHASSPRSPMVTFLSAAPVVTMSISNDNYLLAVGMADGTIVFYQALTGKPVMRVEAPQRRVLALNLTDDRHPIALCEVAGQAMILSLVAG